MQWRSNGEGVWGRGFFWGGGKIEDTPKDLEREKGILRWRNFRKGLQTKEPYMSEK